MYLKKSLIIIFIFVLAFTSCTPENDQTRFESRHTNTVEALEWFDKAKFGLFIHWGLYAIPAGEWDGEEYKDLGEWLMQLAKIPVDEYSQLE